MSDKPGTDYSIPQIDRLIKGLEIIRKYETVQHPCAAERDSFYCGSYETREQMTDEERHLMSIYGWTVEYESWAFYV